MIKGKKKGVPFGIRFDSDTKLWTANLYYKGDGYFVGAFKTYRDASKKYMGKFKELEYEKN